MSDKIIALFSSDAREKYKSDVFRTLALPHKYVIHFRYQIQYIQPELLSNLNSLLGRMGVIFYANGNDTSIPKEQRVITFLSIRKVIIRDIYQDNNNGLVNFYLELGEFVDCKFVENTPRELSTPYFSFSELDVEYGTLNAWHDRVDQFKNYLPNALYYFISSITQGNKELVPQYEKLEQKSLYYLSDESTYHIHLSFYDPSNGQYSLQVENAGDAVDISCSEYKVGAPRDTDTFGLYTHTISTRFVNNETTFSIKSPSPELAPNRTIDLSVQIQWKVIKKIRKIVTFGLFTVIAALGVALGTLAASNLSNASFTICNILLGILALILIGTASCFLFWMFNKT